MIKLIYMGRKHAGATIEEFKAYYLDHHAPLFMENAPRARKYTINFPTARRAKEAPPLDFDFITEIWWEDVESIRAFYKSEAYRNIIRPDELKLFATGSAIYFDEFVQKA